MTLYEICEKIAFIEEDMMNGAIEFECTDNLYLAMHRHPAQDLDEILSPVGFPAFTGQEVPLDDVKEMLKSLKAFKKAFKVKALNEVIKDVQLYIDNAEKN